MPSLRNIQLPNVGKTALLYQKSHQIHWYNNTIANKLANISISVAVSLTLWRLATFKDF